MPWFSKLFQESFRSKFNNLYEDKSVKRNEKATAIN